METFLDEVNKRINGVPLQACYHCRKCTAGCPGAPYMEYNPNKVIKMIQNGQKDKVLSSSTIWLCMSCETCITRCPNNVDIARMMDTPVGTVKSRLMKARIYLRQAVRTFARCTSGRIGSPRRSRALPPRATTRRTAQPFAAPSGTCWVMQWMLPPPRRISRAGMPTTSRSGKALA